MPEPVMTFLSRFPSAPLPIAVAALACLAAHGLAQAQAQAQAQAPAPAPAPAPAQTRSVPTPAAAASSPASPASTVAAAPVPTGAAATAMPAATAAAAELQRVVVTGNPLDSREPAAPVTVLEGDALVLRRGSSLGATLDGLPGVSASWFGPNANRPVIRGLDGERVRILNNAGASVDASSLSFDHAVPLDPLVVERVEVLRGPAALLYGGSAVGGVVNTLDNRIPQRSPGGTSGAAEWRLGGADRERAAAALLETGNDRYALHVDLAGRRTDDLRVPDFVPVREGEALARTRGVANSASRGDSGAVGGSMLFDHGYIGASVDRDDRRYGIVVEPGTIIDMTREHAGLAGEWRAPGGEGPVQKVRAHLNRTRYDHQEIEGSGEVGTTFASRGDEARIELTHATVPVAGGLRGVFGGQWERTDFSALGEEAFVPTTNTRKRALFVLEELSSPLGTTSAGLRVERVTVGSAGDADPADARFGGPAQRRFSLRSASLSQLVPLGRGWSLTAAATSSERAPTSFELYANGLHAATAAYERGDPNLAIERGRNLDLALAWKGADSHLRLGAFVSRFSNFIGLDATGATIDVPGHDGEVESAPEYRFAGMPARLRGVELEAGHRLKAAGWTVDLQGRYDLTRARRTDTGEALARIAPRRFTVGVDAASGPWRWGAEVVNVARQDRVPSTDTPTAGYTLVNLSLSRRFVFDGGDAAGGRDALWFLRLNNAGDRLAYSATSVSTIRALAPLPGRSLQTGVRVSF